MTSGRIRLLRSRPWSGRRRRWAGRGSSESGSLSSPSSAERLLPLLKGDEDRDEGCRRVFKIALLGALVMVLFSFADGVLVPESSSRRLQNARSILPRHCWSISIIVFRSYLPPRPS